MAEVKRKITDNDPFTGKKLVAYLTNAPLNGSGYPSMIQWVEKVKETDETTDASPANSTERAVAAVRPVEYTFHINNRKISSVTKLYLPDNTVDINAITLAEYFTTKVISTFPGVAGGDQAWKMAEGYLREVIAIKQANGELPV